MYDGYRENNGALCTGEEVLGEYMSTCVCMRERKNDVI